MPDDPTISDTAIIWRYVSPQQTVLGKDGEGVLPSTGAFDDSSDGDPNVRDPCVRGTGSDVGGAEDVPGSGGRSLHGGVSSQPRHGLERVPEPDEPDHVVVRGNKTKKVKKALKAAARWVVLGTRPVE